MPQRIDTCIIQALLDCVLQLDKRSRAVYVHASVADLGFLERGFQILLRIVRWKILYVATPTFVNHAYFIFLNLSHVTREEQIEGGSVPQHIIIHGHEVRSSP